MSPLWLSSLTRKSREMVVVFMAVSINPCHDSVTAQSSIHDHEHAFNHREGVLRMSCDELHAVI